MTNSSETTAVLLIENKALRVTILIVSTIWCFLFCIFAFHTFEVHSGPLTWFFIWFVVIMYVFMLFGLKKRIHIPVVPTNGGDVEHQMTKSSFTAEPPKYEEVTELPPTYQEYLNMFPQMNFCEEPLNEDPHPTLPSDEEDKKDFLPSQ